jgi:hypothetical protein
VEENTDEVRQLRQQLVDAQTTNQVDLIDRKLAVLKKHQE